MTDHNKGCPDCAAMGRNFQSFATSVALEILVQSAFHGGQIYHDIPDEIECDPRDNSGPRCTLCTLPTRARWRARGDLIKPEIVQRIRARPLAAGMSQSSRARA